MKKADTENMQMNIKPPPKVPTPKEITRARKLGKEEGDAAFPSYMVATCESTQPELVYEWDMAFWNQINRRLKKWVKAHRKE